jgi:hypothetical protein
MTTLFKLTDEHGYTRQGHPNALLWGPGVTHTATGKRQELCTDGVIHAYTDPLLAMIFNPIHASYHPARLWRAEGEVIASDALKVGVRSLTVLEEIDLPEISTAQRVRFAILCAWEVCDDPAWRQWAERWLDGTGRSEKAAAWAALAAAAAAREAAAREAAREAAAAAALGKPLGLAAIARRAMQEES